MQANDLHKLRRSTMKTAAIIAEYNPFHNGHKYQIEETRRRTGADFIAVVMSGDFVQRGAPAIYSKFLRTRSALLSGADLVVEMPVFGSLSAAQDFARCGISLFHHMGIIDVLSFGSEAGEIKKLQELADQAGTETEEQSDLIRKSLRSGLTYPQALALARKDSVPVSPNDILAVEYLDPETLRSRVSLRRAGRLFRFCNSDPKGDLCAGSRFFLSCSPGFPL